MTYRFILLFILITQTAFSGEKQLMETFNRKNLVIEDNWSLKEVAYNDSELITFFRKNLGVSKIAGHKDLSNLVYLTIKYNPADNKGFPSSEDNAVLSDFEDMDIPKIENSSNSIHVASVLKNGIKDFLFYVSDKDRFLESLNKNNSRLLSFEVNLELAPDPNWEIYKDFP